MSSSEVRPRRWLQFSLRTLFVLMLVVAAFFGGRESMRPAMEAERAKALQLQAREQERTQALVASAQAELARYQMVMKDGPALQRLVNRKRAEIAELKKAIAPTDPNGPLTPKD